MILLLALARGTAWADHPILPDVRIAPGQPAPINQGQIIGSGDIWLYSTWGVSSCTTGLFDATLRHHQVNGTHVALAAINEIPIFTQDFATRSGQDFSLVSREPGRVFPLPGGNNSPDSRLIRTGVFPGAQEKVTTNVSAEQVRTGVFEGPEGFLDEAQGDSPGNSMRLGLWRLPKVRNGENRTESPHGIQGRELRKKGRWHRIWPRSRRER